MAEYKNQSFKKGDMIMVEGDQPHCAYILKSGSVEMTKKRSDGSEAVLSILKAGDILGAMSMVDAEPRCASVRALEDVTLIVVDGPTFKQKQEALDVFSRKLVQTLIQRLRVQNQQIADMTCPSELLKAAQKGQIEKSKSPHTNVLIKEDYREKLDFGSINFLMGDANPQSRQGIKGGLHMQGFREIDDVSNANDLRKKVGEGNYDLILLDGSLGVPDIASTIKDIRHGDTTVSPFCVIFCVIDQPDPKTLELLADAGLDDVLVKPIALGNVIDRVERRTKARKPFVVTLNYVGPDRRSSRRPLGEEIPLVDVPNPLTYKALRLPDEKDYADSVQSALARIETLKIERHAVQINWLCQKIESLTQTKQDTTYFLNTILSVTETLMHKLGDKALSEYYETCEEIIKWGKAFKAGMAEMAGSDWETFSALSQKIHENLGPR